MAFSLTVVKVEVAIGHTPECIHYFYTGKSIQKKVMIWFLHNYTWIFKSPLWRTIPYTIPYMWHVEHMQIQNSCSYSIFSILSTLTVT